MNYVAPEHGKQAFNCPHCHAYAQMVWTSLYDKNRNLTQLEMAKCTIPNCRKHSLWMRQFGQEEQQAAGLGALFKEVSFIMLYPLTATAPMPSEDLPEDCKWEYLEARDIAARSPRGAAALLRLSLQMLCKNLGLPGKNINDDIQTLVNDRNLSEMVQQALDAIRVVGNNAVHPGELDIHDEPETVGILFELVNIIVDEMISKPNKAKSMFDRLPAGAKAAIAKRDAPKP